MEKKKQSILFYKEDISRLEELYLYYNKNSIGDVSYNDVVRQAIKIAYGELQKRGQVGGNN